MSYELPETETMDDAAVTIHEWFSSLMRAGFTERQALILLTNTGGVG